MSRIFTGGGALPLFYVVFSPKIVTELRGSTPPPPPPLAFFFTESLYYVKLGSQKKSTKRLKMTFLQKRVEIGPRTPGIVKGNKSLKISHLVWFQ